MTPEQEIAQLKEQLAGNKKILDSAMKLINQSVGDLNGKAGVEFANKNAAQALYDSRQISEEVLLPQKQKWGYLTIGINALNGVRSQLLKMNLD